MVWLKIAFMLLPVILKWIEKAQREGVMKEGEKRLLAELLAKHVEELEIFDDVEQEVIGLRDSDLDDILTGSVREPDTGSGGAQ